MEKAEELNRRNERKRKKIMAEKTEGKKNE